MTNWNTEGHLTDLALELLAVGEAETQELSVINGHLAECKPCRARSADWRDFIQTFESVPPLEPSPAFDDRVMERVHVAAAPARAAWVPKLARRLRPVALGAAAAWSAIVIGGGLWLGSQAEIPAAALVARGIGFVTNLAWAGVLEVGAAIHLSGVLDLWARAVQAVPGPGIVGAVAVMTAVSGLAIWTLHRVVGYQPSRIDAHV